MILKLKKINSTTIKVLYFLEDVDIDKVLACNKISLAEKNSKYFIGYLHDDYKTKPLHIMVPRTSTYVKS